MFRFPIRSWAGTAAVAGAVLVTSFPRPASGGLIPAAGGLNQDRAVVQVGIDGPARSSEDLNRTDRGGPAVDVAGTENTHADDEADSCFASRKTIGRTFGAVSESSREHGNGVPAWGTVGASADGDLSTYLACWDGTISRRSGGDVNNLVIEIRTTLPSSTPTPTSALASAASQSAKVADDASAISEPLLIPLPPALWSGLSGLVGLGVIRAYRHATRRARW